MATPPNGANNPIEEPLRSTIKAGFCDVELWPLAENTWSVSTPFFFSDGDGYPIIVSLDDGLWRISDNGAAVGHLDYSDFEWTKAKVERLERFATSAGARLRDGALVVESFDPPTAVEIADFCKAIAMVHALPHVDSTKADDTRFPTAVRAAISASLGPRTQPHSNWHLPGDKRKVFPVELLLDTNGDHVLTFTVATPQRADRVTSSLFAYRRWGLNPTCVVALESSAKISSSGIGRLEEAAGGTESIVTATRDDARAVATRLKQLGVDISVN